MTALEQDEEPIYIEKQEDEEPIFLQEMDSLEIALRMFDDSGLPDLPVVDVQRDNLIIGHATQIKALSHFNQALVAASEEEHHG